MIRNNIYHTHGIYKIVNTQNQTVYVGKTITNFGDRWDCHKAQLRGSYHDNKQLQQEWNEYGEQNFSFEIIEIITDDTLLDEKEQYYISHYKQHGSVYNIHKGGKNGCRGEQISDYAKSVIGLKNKEHMTGYKMPLEVRKRMSESQRNKKLNTPETVREIRRLYYDEHKSTGEISKIMDMKKSTVCSIVSYKTWKNI